MTGPGLLAGRTAVVTGGASGIGAACALALPEAGADVAILVNQDDEAAREAESAIVARGRRGQRFAVEVGDEAQVEDAIAGTRWRSRLPNQLGKTE